MAINRAAFSVNALPTRIGQPDGHDLAVNGIHLLTALHNLVFPETGGQRILAGGMQLGRGGNAIGAQAGLLQLTTFPLFCVVVSNTIERGPHLGEIGGDIGGDLYRKRSVRPGKPVAVTAYIIALADDIPFQCADFGLGKGICRAKGQSKYFHASLSQLVMALEME
jgi:hypothetical protein